MIRYSLSCSRSHEFEGWFGSSEDFDLQQERGLLECPICGSHDIGKMLMAPSVSISRKKEARAEARAGAMPESAVATGAPEPPVPSLQLAGLNPDQRAILAQMRELKQRLMSKAENVGDRFSEEARKIHYGEAEKRGIYGRASLDDATELAEEGIDFLPLPDLPDEQN